MDLLDIQAFNKIINIKSKSILELEIVIEKLDLENSLGYHDTTISDLKNKIIYLEELICTLKQEKDAGKSIDIIRKIAYKGETPPYIKKKSPDILFNDYLNLLDSIERMTLDFIEYKKQFSISKKET